MSKVQDILQLQMKPKERVKLLTERIIESSNLVDDLIELLKTGSDVEKGTSAEVLKHVSKAKPEIVEPYIDILINYVNYKAPRVKWGVPETIGNLAQKYPDQVVKAVPNLLINTKDKSTVIRWCAAFALTEIAKYNYHSQSELVTKFNIILKTEQNNGVKNVYIKALKIIEKKK